MEQNTLIALMGFAFVTSVTPGPNNIMLMASGVNFGPRRTLPHALGVSIGFGAMVAMLGVGLVGQAFDRWPVLGVGLKWVSLAYMLWLAARMARATAPSGGAARARPLGFAQAAAFQWVNPKAWVMAIGALSVYAAQGGAAAALMVAAVFMAVNLPSVWVWVIAGQGLRRWLANPARLRVFNLTMAGLLVASMLPVIWH